MTKTELIQKIQDTDSNMTKKKAEEIFSVVFDSIRDELKNNGKVTITGFGTFSVKERAARVGVNPQSGEPLKIPAKKVPVFKAGKLLKEVVK